MMNPLKHKQTIKTSDKLHKEKEEFNR